MSSPDVRSYDAEASYRRMHRTTVVTTMVSVLPVGIILIAVQAQDWWEATVIGGAFLVAAGVTTQWKRSGYPRFGTIGVLLCLIVWGLGALLFENSVSFVPLAMVGAMTVPRLPQGRGAAIAGFGLLVGAVGAAALWRSPELSVVEFAVVPAGVAVFVTSTMLYADRHWVIFHELEQAREAEAELGIMRERVRFASELHDIQGHTLHVVKLKVALAAKLVTEDPGRAAEELREVHELVGETVTQTKELAYAQRRLNLTSELENAKNLFEAAGIHVEIERQEGQEELEASPRNELISQVLREITTNILRHAQASQVRIGLSTQGITVINDGGEVGSPAAHPGPPSQPELRGLETLRQRVADSGGQLHVESRGTSFLTAVRFTPESQRRGAVR